MIWKKFWQPEGKGYLLFFAKFFLFTVIAFLFWSAICAPYNSVLRRVSTYQLRKELPVLDVRAKEDRGKFEILLAPYTKGPVKPVKQDSLAVSLYLNTIHFNIIPFISLLLATPLFNWRRLVVFLVIGAIFLSLTHYYHIQLDVKAYYFKIQEKKGYFPVGQIRMTPEQHSAYVKWVWKIRLVNMLQGIYGTSWLHDCSGFYLDVIHSEMDTNSFVTQVAKLENRIRAQGRG